MKKGWKGNRYGHSLASKGVRTKRLTQAIKKQARDVRGGFLITLNTAGRSLKKETIKTILRKPGMTETDLEILFINYLKLGIVKPVEKKGTKRFFINAGRFFEIRDMEPAKKKQFIINTAGTTGYNSLKRIGVLEV